MKIYKLKDLTEVYYHINRDFLVNPSEVISYSRGVQSFADDLIIEVQSSDLELNLYKIGFNPDRKWNHLIRSYIEGADYLGFWEKVKKSTGTSLQFRFKNREGPNGPCLIALVLTRDNSKGPWTAVKVMWRTAELHRKFAADLVLVNKFLTEIPTECEANIKIKKITFFLAQAFQSSRLIGPLIPSFCTEDELDIEHSYPNRALDHYNKVYKDPNRPTLKFAPAQRMQLLYDNLQAGTLPDWSPDEVSLRDEVLKQIEYHKR